MTNKKKQPVRTCLGCGEPKEKKALIRIVRTPEGEIHIDPTGKKSGRGAYICPDAQCLAKAKKAHRLEKSFSCQIPDDIYARLEEELRGGGENV